MNKEIITEIHPLEPFLPEKATLLMLGSFPPPRARWSMDFYYPNLQNDMWRIFGLVFFGDRDHFIDSSTRKFDKAKLEEFLTERGIALSDTAREVVRRKDNASDAFLDIVKPVDITALLCQIPQCRYIITTGQKAAETLAEITATATPKVGESVPAEIDGRMVTHFRTPSTSRAYPKPLVLKAEDYRRIFDFIGLT